MTAPTSGPNVAAAGPAANPNAGSYYYEVYVWQDPSWNLVNSGWVGATGTAAQGYGAGQMAAAQYNTQARTRVWNQDTNSWLGWQTSGSAPVQDAAGNPVGDTTDTSSGLSPVEIAVGVGIVGLILWGIFR